VHAQAFHVVDLVAEVRLEQNGTVGQRPWLDVAQRDAAESDGKADGPAKSPLKQENVAAGQEGSVGDVVARAALDRESTGRGTADKESVDIACLVETALRDRDLSVPASGKPLGTNTSASMPLFAGSERSPGGDAIACPRASRPSLP